MPAVIAQAVPAHGEAIAEKLEEASYKEVKAESYGPISDSKNIERFINDYFADIPILANIARCESQYRHLSKDGDVLRGKKNRFDIGVMQINELYHAEKAKKLGLNLYNLNDNVAYARHLYEDEGAKPWMASSACWAKSAQSEIALR